MGLFYTSKKFITIYYPNFNQFIYNFHLENVNYNKEELGFTKELIKFDLSSVFYLFSQSLLFWFKPFLHNAENLPQMIQSFENIFVMIIILYYLKKLYSKNIAKTYYIILSAFFVSVPYALIVAKRRNLSKIQVFNSIRFYFNYFY